MSIDQDGREALAVAERLRESRTPTTPYYEPHEPGTRALLAEAAEQIRWLVESRARWQAACAARQITLFEDEHR